MFDGLSGEKNPYVTHLRSGYPLDDLLLLLRQIPVHPCVELPVEQVSLPALAVLVVPVVPGSAVGAALLSREGEKCYVTPTAIYRTKSIRYLVQVIRAEAAEEALLDLVDVAHDDGGEVHVLEEQEDF